MDVYNNDNANKALPVRSKNLERWRGTDQGKKGGRR